MTGTWQQREIRLRVKPPDSEAAASLLVRYSDSSTIAHLLRAMEAHFAVPKTERELRHSRTDGRLVSGALLRGAQLLHGDLLEFAMPAEGAPHPELSNSDVFRLVHQGGPQLDLAWPIQRDVPQDLFVDANGSAYATKRSGRRAVRLACSPDGTSAIVTAAAPLAVTQNGLPLAADGVVFPGSVLTVQGGRGRRIEFRLMRAADHEDARRAHYVAYRVAARQSESEVIASVTVRLSPPPARRNRRAELVDIAFQEIPMVGIYLLMLTRTYPWGLAFLLLPGSRLGYRAWRYHRMSVDDDRARQEWERVTARELGGIKRLAEDEVAELRRLHPAFRELALQAVARTPGLWQWRPRDPGFGTLKVGESTWESASTGQLDGPSTAAGLEHFRAHIDAARKVEAAPHIQELFEHLAIVGRSGDVDGVARTLITRIALTYSPSTLPFAALLPGDATIRESLDWLKWLPHFSAHTTIYAPNRIARGHQESRDALEGAVTLADETFGHNSALDRTTSESRVLLIIHEASGVSLPYLSRLLEVAREHVAVVWLGSSADRVPDLISNVIDLSPVSQDEPPRVLPAGTLLAPEVALEDGDTSDTAIDDAITALAPLVDESAGVVSLGIPTEVDLPSSLGVTPGSVQTDIQSMWAGSRAVTRLAARLGQGSTGPFGIEFVREGPHALIGGTTGSGKSELLRGMILSLAVRYPPTEVAFLLIDFKGGAGLSDLAELPHCIGSVSNLETGDVRRLVAFLQREVNRRQHLLRGHQGEYIAFRGANAARILPRLVVVIDEFGGFLGDKGENETAVVNIAARGRSLGIHLVLATQRPSGTVGRQISANVNARFCLRTLDEADSVEVIDSPNAAKIPRVLPGRCFARLEAGQLAQFQAALTSSEVLTTIHDPTAVVVESFDPLNRPLERRASESDTDEASTGQKDWFLLRETICGLQPARPTHEEQPRLAPSLSDPANRERHIETSPVDCTVELGRRDEPHLQHQGPHRVDLLAGSLLVQGSSLSGKSTVLVNIARQFKSANPGGQLVVVDCGGGDLQRQLTQADWRLADPPSGDATFLLDQLLLPAPADAVPVLLLVDRLEVFAERLRDIGPLQRLLANGARWGVAVAAAVDERLDLNRGLRRAFRWRFGLRGQETPGRLYDELEVETQAAVPSAPVEAAVPTGVVRRPVGIALAPPRDQRSPAGRVYLGVDELRHTRVDVALRPGFGIVGTSGSGRTTTLLTLALRLQRELQLPVPFLSAYELDASATGLVSLARLSKLPPESQAAAVSQLATFWADPKTLTAQDRRWRAEHLGLEGPLARYLFVDDAERESLLFQLAASAGQVAWTNLADAVAATQVRVVAAGAYSILERTGLMSPLNWSLQNFLVLQPPDLAPGAQSGGFNVNYERLVNPRVGREYEPGHGTLVQTKGTIDIAVDRDDDVRELVSRVRSSDATDW